MALVIKNYEVKGGLSAFITRKMKHRVRKESDIVGLNEVLDSETQNTDVSAQGRSLRAPDLWFKMKGPMGKGL